MSLVAFVNLPPSGLTVYCRSAHKASNSFACGFIKAFKQLIELMVFSCI